MESEYKNGVKGSLSETKDNGPEAQAGDNMICMKTLLLMMNISQGDFIINVFLGEDGDQNE